jgi:D-alanyl-D-alanine carboxypeptidase
MPYATLPCPKPSKVPRGRFALYVFAAVGLLLLGAVTWIIFVGQGGTPGESPQTGQQAQFDKTQLSTNDPASPWVVVNKQRPLEPREYVPADLTTPGVPLKYEAGSMESQLRAETATALQELFAAAAGEGIELIFVSGYRSYAYQEHLFNYYVGLQGEATAEQQSARPGHSEHQTGWAADVGAASRECEIETCFGDMPEGQWVAEHAHRFGFTIRYPKGATATTGFDYEPWHLRYVGKDLAAELKRSNTQTLETFFDLPAAAAY